MSLLIPDKEIHNLHYSGQKVKAAYYNGKKVWTERRRVRWYDNLGNLLKTEWVTDGEAATPPNNTDFDTEFYGYNFEGWNADYSSITADVDISATTTIETAYLFRTGYGINYDLLSSGFSASCTAYDTDSSVSYTSVATGSVSADEIKCSFTGARISDSAAFRSMRYRSVLVNMDALNAAGHTKLKFSGNYSFGSGQVYSTSNLRSSFVSLQPVSQVSAAASSGISSSLAWQHFIAKPTAAGKYTSVSAVSGSINGSLALPTTGSYYLIVGALSKAFKGTVETNIDNIWLE